MITGGEPLLFPEELYNLDILDGSPPCSTFSMSGLREDAWGKEKKFKEGQKTQVLERALKKLLFCDSYAYVIRTPIREHLQITKSQAVK